MLQKLVHKPKLRVLTLAVTSILSVIVNQSVQAEDKVTVSEPNGFINDNVTDMDVKTEASDVKITRQWNGQEWKINPHWESLSTRFSNMTGSNSAQDSTVPINTKTISNAAPSGTSSVSYSSSLPSGGVPGCWVWVDDDWQPTQGETWVDLKGVTYQGVAPVDPKRTTPFNKIMGEDKEQQPEQPVLTRVTVDYASLCAGYSSSTGHTVEDKEAIRRQNELYLGENGNYSFSNRSVLKKQPVEQPTPKDKTNLYQDFIDGKATLDIKTDNGYHWIDKGGDWIDYNVQGQVISWGDKNKNLTWLMRDLTGILRGVTDQRGNVLYSLHYDDKNRLSQIKDYPNKDLGDNRETRNVAYKYDDRNRLISVTDVRGNATNYEYDNLNNLVKIDKQGTVLAKMSYDGKTLKSMQDALGNTTTYQSEYNDPTKEFFSKTVGPQTEAGQRVQEDYHNRQGRLKRQVVNGKTQVDIKYDTINRVDYITNVRGFTTQVERDEFENIKSIIQPDGSKQSYTYSPIHLGLTKSVDPLGVETQYQRDDKGNLIKRIEAAGTADARTTTYTRNDKGQITAITYQGSNGNPDSTWQMSYDAAGNIKTVTDPEGHQSAYQYDRMGNLTVYTDGNGNSTRYQYDAAGNLLSQTDANGHTTQYQYDDKGVLSKAIDENGNATDYQYDLAGRLTGITHAEGGTYRISYNGQGQAVKETDEDGRSTEIRYDNFLRMQAHKDGKGNVTSYNYNLTDGNPGSLSAPTETTYPTFKVQQRYDNMERPTTQTVLNPTEQGTEGLITNNKYDKRGQLIETTDENGKTSYYQYNVHGELIKYTNSLGNSINITRDSHGNVTQMTDYKGKTIRFTYDKNNQITSQTLPTGEVTHYGHDNNGNQDQIIYPNGTVIKYRYDKADRIIGMTASNPNQSGSEPITYTYGYDSASNLTTWQARQVRGEISYDKTGLVTGERVTYPNGVTLSYGVNYTDAGYVRTQTMPDGTIISYQYNEMGELDSVTVPGEGTIKADQFKWVAPQKITLPGGTTISTKYDGLLNPTAIVSKDVSQKTLLEQLNRFGKQSELVSKSINGDSYQYQYNSEQQLTQVQKNGSTLDIYVLDANGNRTQVSQVNGNITYDDSNRITQYSDVSFSYDSNGNLVTRTENGKVTHYAYDLLNRISQIKDTNNQLIASYDYDIWDNRVAKTTYKDGQASTTYYFYNQDGLLAETNEQGQVTTQYGFAPSDSWQTNPLFIKTDQGYAYYHNDQLGTPRLATDKSGNVVWQADYATNGEATLSSNNQIVSNLRFPGQYFDVESNLHYNTRRFYDPKIGRYITQDPIGYSGGMNLYNYVNSDPINNADPTGEILPAIGAVASRVVMAYASCVAFCKAEHMIFNAINGCETDDNCFKDCLSPFVILTHGRAGKVARGKGMPVTNGPSGGKPKAPRSSVKQEEQKEPHFETSRQARRDTMRNQGIPTSQQPKSQSKNSSGREYTYEVPKSGGGKEYKSAQQQTMDRSHPGENHWETGTVKTDPRTGEPRLNDYGRPKIKNDKSKANYD